LGIVFVLKQKGRNTWLVLEKILSVVSLGWNWAMLLGEEKLLCRTTETLFLCADIDKNCELVDLSVCHFM